ncbi:MAG: hypothetical protein ACLQUZ_13660 [Rhizomicrobium sp.]
MLTFEGIETFVGDATQDDGTTWLKVERALPKHPWMKNMTEVLQPSDAVRGREMARLEAETRRRGHEHGIRAKAVGSGDVVKSCSMTFVPMVGTFRGGTARKRRSSARQDRPIALAGRAFNDRQMRTCCG